VVKPTGRPPGRPRTDVDAEVEFAFPEPSDDRPPPFVPEPTQAKIWDIIAEAAPGSLSIIGFGGAFGGGKTRALIELAIDLALQYPGNKILVGRKDFKDLKDTVIPLFFEVCDPLLISKKNDNENWVEIRASGWPKGIASRITFRELKDVTGIGGGTFGAVLLDEAGEIPDAKPISVAQMLLSRLRWRLPFQSAPYWKGLGFARIPVPKYVFLACSNPWPGWFKEWFIDRRLDEEAMAKAKTRVHFIPSKVSDNPHMHEGYEESLRATFAPDVARRFLDGDWGTFTGQIYSHLSRREHEWKGELPPYNRVIGGLDFGGEHSTSHFSAGIVAVVTTEDPPKMIVVDMFKARGPGIAEEQKKWMVLASMRWCSEEKGLEKGSKRQIQWKADKSQMVAIQEWRKIFWVSATNGGPGSVEEGIKHVSQRMMPQKDGKPGLYFLEGLSAKDMTGREHTFFDDIASYIADPETGKPKVDIDLADALRYAEEAMRANSMASHLLANVLGRVV
jgi:hypothetical protein